jgi:SSS family solute:Na+ symporter
MLVPRATGSGACTGLLAGILGNACLWQFAPSVSWLWWNLIGFAVTAAAGILLSGPRRTGVPGLNLHPREVLAQRARLNWRRRSYGLLLWFLLLFGVLLALSYALPQ